jgi:hypothetical protein
MAKQKKSWRDLIPVHPAADLFPMMSEAELRVWGEGMKKNPGLTVILTTWAASQNDDEIQLIDGRNRLAAMELVYGRLSRDKDGDGAFWAGDKLVACCEPVYGGDPYALVECLNINRRHLTAEQKRDLIAKLADWSKSDRAIAADLKTNKNLVGKVRKTLPRWAQMEKEKTAEQKKVSTVPGGTVEKRTGKDGKVRKQPVAKKQKAAGKAEAKAEPKAEPFDPIEWMILSAAGEPGSAASPGNLPADMPYRVHCVFLQTAKDAIEDATNVITRLVDRYGQPVDEDMCKAAQAAAAAWLEVARILTSRRAKAEVKVEPTPVVETSCGADPFAPPPVTNGSAAA